MINLLTTLTLSLLLISSSFTARVVRVIDGDTIVVLTENHEQIKIRLEVIDCPEMKQDFGYRAKQATSDLCFNKKVRIEKSGIDQYGRTLAFVYVDDICVNKELLKLGMAWHYKHYNKDPELAKLEGPLLLMICTKKRAPLMNICNLPSFTTICDSLLLPPFKRLQTLEAAPVTLLIPICTKSCPLMNI